jgi:hypothetical protein
MPETINDVEKKEVTKKKLQLIERVLHDQQLAASSKTILSVLLHTFYNDITGRCDPGKGLIVFVSGVQITTVKTSVKELKDRGVMSSYQRKKRNREDAYGSNQYSFNWDWVGTCAWNKCKNCQQMRENDLGRKTTHPRSENDLPLGQQTTHPRSENIPLTTETTTEETTEKTLSESERENEKEIAEKESNSHKKKTKWFFLH